jgi:hypothetical protein
MNRSTYFRITTKALGAGILLSACGDVETPETSDTLAATDPEPGLVVDSPEAPFTGNRSRCPMACRHLI